MGILPFELLREKTIEKMAVTSLVSLTINIFFWLGKLLAGLKSICLVHVEQKTFIESRI